MLSSALGDDGAQPDPRAQRRRRWTTELHRRFGIIDSPSEVLFVDNIQLNVEPPREAGTGDRRIADAERMLNLLGPTV
jgi:hypothetical protein